MAFRLKASESVGDGIKRNVRREVENALEHLGASSTLPPQGADALIAVHEVRKDFKRVRAALRLVREGLGDETYHSENLYFRDAARPLTEVRDAEVLVETWDRLGKQFARQIAPEVLAHVRGALLANQARVTQRGLDDDHVLETVKAMTQRAFGRLGVWRIDRDGWEALEQGLKRVYRDGRRAHARAAESPTVDNLHEWRKQAKYLWHQLQLLESAWTDSEKKLGDEVHELTRLLGEDHDVAVLRQTLAADPLAYGGQRALKNLFVYIDRQRQAYEKQAFTLGRRLYADSPRAFTRRIRGYWQAWRVENRGAGHHARSAYA